MKKLLIAIALASLFVGCKTTEENYRQAYEKAISGRNNDIDTTLYGNFRRELKEQGVITASGEKIAIRTAALSLVDANESSTTLEKYSVAV
jgi:mannose/cellobiose epimerase-like protein (N-acyl-D-glucosamine 2-epimerase family)